MRVVDQVSSLKPQANLGFRKFAYGQKHLEEAVDGREKGDSCREYVSKTLPRPV